MIFCLPKNSPLGFGPRLRVVRFPRQLLLLTVELVECCHGSPVWKKLCFEDLVWIRKFTIKGSFSSLPPWANLLSRKLLVGEISFNTGIRSPITHCAGTLGVERSTIATYFKDPSRGNIHQQVRFVDKITIRFEFSYWSLLVQLDLIMCWDINIICLIMFFSLSVMDKHLGFLIPLAATGMKVQVMLCRINIHCTYLQCE